MRRASVALTMVVLSSVAALPALALNIAGTNGNDTLRGTAKADKINGKAGNDRISGFAGNDTLIGGPGRDRVDGGPGDDRLLIRDGVRDTAVCGTGRDTVTADTVDAVGANCENILRPTPPPPLPPPVGSRANPLPLGQPVSITAGSEQWRFRILSSIPDATAMILAENQFNDPPAPGFQFFMTAVEVTYVSGSAPQDPWQRIASDLNTVGDANVAYTQYGASSCGVTPDDFLFKGDLFPGGTATGNICWSVRSSDVASLVGYFEFSNGLFYVGLR